MTTYSNISDTEVNPDQPINSATAKKFRDNVLAIIEGDSSAVSAGKQIANAAFADNTINGGKLVHATVGQDEIGSGAIHQAELDTSQSEVSTSTTGAWVRLALPGGEYGFYPRIRTSSTPNTVVEFQIFYANTSGGQQTSYTTSIAIYLGATTTGYGQQRYINSSPPFNLGDGEIPFFTFVNIVNNSVIATYAATVPPWAYNGPTNIMGKPDRNGRKWQTKKALNRETGEIETQNIEITNDIKNADMSLIPHPFIGSAGDIVLLDPMDSEKLLDIHESGESIADLLYNDYIRIDNANLSRNCPPGVQPKRWRWRNTG